MGDAFPSCTFTITAKVLNTSVPVGAFAPQTLIRHEVGPRLSTSLKILMMSPQRAGI